MVLNEDTVTGVLFQFIKRLMLVTKLHLYERGGGVCVCVCVKGWH